MSYGTCQLPLRVCVFFSWFPWPARPLLVSLSASLYCSESVDSELRICEFTPATACVLLRVCFSFLSSSQDSMYCTLSLTVVCAHFANRASFISATDSFSAGS